MRRSREAAKEPMAADEWQDENEYKSSLKSDTLLMT